MRVYFVQHGEALDEKADPKRPLSEKGRRYTESVARALSVSGMIHADKIWHSGKLRAAQTAEIFAIALGMQGRAAELTGIAPMDSPSACIETLKTEKNNVMIVGHLPHLEKTVSELLCGAGSRDKALFNNSGVICLERKDDGGWAVAPLFEK